jgi:sortase A
MLAALAAAIAVASSGAPAQVTAGAPLGVMRIPRIGVRTAVAQGGMDLYTADWPRELNDAAAHYPVTSLPWQRGVTAFAGHRTTYARPFLHLNLLRRGDAIILRTRWGTFWYRVTGMRIVGPERLDVLGLVRRSGAWVRPRDPRGYRLTLTACHPPRRATHRLVVLARLAAVT